MDGYSDLGFAKLDTGREERTGFPEVVFCQGKADEHLLGIFMDMYKKNGRVFGTRATEHQYEYIRKSIPQVEYDEISRILKVPGESDGRSAVTGTDVDNGGRQETGSIRNSGETPVGIGEVAVCTAGTADIPVAEEAAQTVEYFGGHVERYYDIGVSGLHRLMDKIDDIRRANCIIAVAGMEGALASVLGGQVSKPVIAVPTSVGYGANLGGLSALLTMINSCANGVSVVNIDNGYGAGYIATQINRLATQTEV
ncbi:MAG: nickel pincer cofactor biosynthesis protein LarB [Eubacterium sp.]|nr:nickel pincer cofactor biosynthesis protein LarB [Eubacterium sp.]